MYMNPGWYTWAACGSTTVISMSRRSSRGRRRLTRRFAVNVPPTPPPRMTMRFIRLPTLLDEDPVVAVEALEGDQMMAGFGDPFRDVGLGALVGRQDGDDVPDLAFADRPDELHQRAGTEAAAGINRLRGGW